MEQKGFIAHEAKGRVFVFRPIVSRKDVDHHSVRTLLHRNFGGSPANLLVNLLEAAPLKKEDLAELEASIQEYRQRQESQPAQRASEQ
jgi:predicted transcriptional regulator